MTSHKAHSEGIPISLRELHEILAYDKETGIFTWKNPRSNAVKAGDIAGSKTSRGYVRLTMKEKIVTAHRLAWFYVTGQVPSTAIDHINGICDDNRFSNLRLIDKIGNAQNIKKAYANNKSGFLGVSPKNGAWIAQIRHQGKKLHLGYFGTPEEAHSKYLAKKRELHAFNTF